MTASRTGTPQSFNNRPAATQETRFLRHLTTLKHDTLAQFDVPPHRQKLSSQILIFGMSRY